MNLEQENACNIIRSLEPRLAAEWLIEKYSFDKENTGDAYLIMGHRSWPKSEQKQLADYFLSNLPHCSKRGYEAFLKFMSLPAFLAALKRQLPEGREQRELILYHLKPLLRSHPSNQKHQALIEEFLHSLSANNE